jgi:two-component system, OmpR family, phosphate regulon sensor histidine kinase PhoR
MIGYHRISGAAFSFLVHYFTNSNQLMKPSARLASLFILLFFLFFNGLQGYLIVERIAESKTKFRAACSAAMLFTLSEYQKIKVIDSAAMPTQAWISYAPKKNDVSRQRSQTTGFNNPPAGLVTDTVEPAFIEMILNTNAFRSFDMRLFDNLFHKAVRAKNMHAAYRLDTIVVQGRKFERQLLQARWAQKRVKAYPHATMPFRVPYNSSISIFVQFANDPAFTKEDLFWPLLAFAAILLIGNTALVFVYRTIRKQKRVNELKTDFINNLTHEMKTPITIASAGLEALEHHVPATERTNFYLHTSKRQLRLLNDFVERILDSAVQDISDFNLKKERTDLHTLFAELIRSHSVVQEKEVNFRLQGTGPVYIAADRLHLETAFHNIIDNAIKYSRGSVDITIDIVENSRDCTIRISDNGMGIPPQFMNNIFEKFFRVPQGDAQAIKGFGLGLYYVSSIVKKHAGHIAVQSKKDAGTEFIITLPKEA